jgi:hypothetical protein
MRFKPFNQFDHRLPKTINSRYNQELVHSTQSFKMILNILTQFIDSNGQVNGWLDGIRDSRGDYTYLNLCWEMRNGIDVRSGGVTKHKTIELDIYIDWESGEGATQVTGKTNNEQQRLITALRERGGRGHFVVYFKETKDRDMGSLSSARAEALSKGVKDLGIGPSNKGKGRA